MYYKFYIEYLQLYRYHIKQYTRNNHCSVNINKLIIVIRDTAAGCIASQVAPVTCNISLGCAHGSQTCHRLTANTTTCFPVIIQFGKRRFSARQWCLSSVCRL